MSASYTRLTVHLVWATFERSPVLTPARARRVHGLLSRLCRTRDCSPLAVGGVEDHVHVLVGLHPSVAVADLVRALKVGTSQFIAETLGAVGFHWQQGYGAFSLRDVERENVRRYVLEQAVRHERDDVIDDWEQTELPATLAKRG